MDKEIVLFEDKKDCCGCGACMNKCPKDAISMVEDEYGFVYPQIDRELCISCGACKNACGFQRRQELQEPRRVYALASKDRDSLKRSASGGAFYTIAENILAQGGVVYGAGYDRVDDCLYPRHMSVEKLEDLQQLQGSKYVQSDTGTCFREIKALLAEGRQVLFSGTPCQVAGLRQFLGKDHDNLILVEIICHGVPNRKMFRDFIRYKESKLNGKIIDFRFRDKTKGQGYITRTDYQIDQSRRQRIEKGELSAYIRFFSKSLILRDSCYSCRFAQKSRVADITIGDYWGFKEEHTKDYGEDLNEKYGVSCMLCNTEKGIAVLEKCGDSFYIVQSDYSRVAAHNKQLNGPTPMDGFREQVFKRYKSDGYPGLEHLYWEKYPKDKVKYFISSIIPESIKRKLK